MAEESDACAVAHGAAPARRRRSAAAHAAAPDARPDADRGVRLARSPVTCCATPPTPGSARLLVEPDADRADGREDGRLPRARAPCPTTSTARTWWSPTTTATNSASLLRDALATKARWVGIMGNPRHAGPHVAALESLGVAPGDIARVHRPIGLNIGSRTPPEIAHLHARGPARRPQLPPRRLRFWSKGPVPPERTRPTPSGRAPMTRRSAAADQAGREATGLAEAGAGLVEADGPGPCLGRARRLAGHAEQALDDDRGQRVVQSLGRAVGVDNLVPAAGFVEEVSSHARSSRPGAADTSSQSSSATSPAGPVRMFRACASPWMMRSGSSRWRRRTAGARRAAPAYGAGSARPRSLPPRARPRRQRPGPDDDGPVDVKVHFERRLP